MVAKPPQRVLKVPTKQEPVLTPAAPDDPSPSPLSLLPGKWSNEPNLIGRGWNMIALPFKAPEGRPNFRLLLNQYNEDLEFFLVDKGVPNRGIQRGPFVVNDTDQLLEAIDYEQEIRQIVAEDRPASDRAGGPKLPIHHEPGLWLRAINEFSDGVDLARLASIPHGDALLALGSWRRFDGPPVIPAVSGLPIGGPTDLDNPYLEPYKFYHENLFQGLFDPTLPHLLLAGANEGFDIVRTTELSVDTSIQTGGIHNIPFIVKQANASRMRSTFWIQELAPTTADGQSNCGPDGKPKLRLQYLQEVMLDFFPRVDGQPGLIQWPHFSINTLEWVAETKG